MGEYTSIQKKAYQKYQLDWMMRNNCSLSDLWTIFTRLAGQEVDRNPEGIPINSSETNLFSIKLRNSFLNDIGFSGKVYSSIDQFLQNEYRDFSYMAKLLTKPEYTEYIKENFYEKRNFVPENADGPRSLKIKEITLLSAEEAKQLPSSIAKCKDMNGKMCWWWLKTPGLSTDTVSNVRLDGSVTHAGTAVDNKDLCIRPVLKITDRSLKPYGAQIRVLNLVWYIIADDMLLCKDAFAHTAFRADKTASDANNYEKSDIKKYLDNWLKKQLANNKDF